MADPNIVVSGLSQTTKIEDQIVRIEIYRLEQDATWTLELVDAEGTSVVWDDPFVSDKAALDAAIVAILEEGLRLFADTSNVIKFPKRAP